VCMYEGGRNNNVVDGQNSSNANKDMKLVVKETRQGLTSLQNIVAGKLKDTGQRLLNAHVVCWSLG